MSKRSFGLFGLMLAGLFVFVACADPQQPTATRTTFQPTAAGQTAVPSTPSNPTSQPQPTEAPSEPDSAAGQVAFAANCAACHNTTDQQLVGPGLAGVATRAASRVPGQSEPGFHFVSPFRPLGSSVPVIQ